MTAEIIDGKQIASDIKEDLKKKIATLSSSPSLAVIIVGNNPASEIYVKSKEKACETVGISSETYHLAEDVSEVELLELINILNEDKNTNGILVQLPLPKHLDEQKILFNISPLKDVDGFHPLNIGLLQKKDKSAFIPCTPKGILHLIHTKIDDLTGLNAVVIGRSNIVGKPIAELLLNENCTVTITHSKTKNLKEICQTADILVVAIGKPEFITKEYVKKGALIIDVGINRTSAGIKGDIEFSSCQECSSAITPVPGGVGPMTIAMLLENTYLAYLKQNNP